MCNVKPFLIIIAIFSVLTLASIGTEYLSASGDGTQPTPDMEEPVDIIEPTGFFHCHVEIRDDLHTPDGFFGIVETFPAGDAQWPVIHTESHTAETLGYTLIQIRGLSVPSQFADRSRPLIFAERERQRFDKAMSYVWALLSQAETLILRNPVATDENGAIVCDVAIIIGGQEINLAEMLINDGHARPAGNWDWGARDVAEVK